LSELNTMSNENHHSAYLNTPGFAPSISLSTF
jgi:hypothetical protein